MGKLEGDVRVIMRQGVAGKITWIEAARGGTVGAADMLMPIGPWQCPLELKVLRPDRLGRLSFKIRPAQRAYHREMARQGSRTAFVFGVAGDTGLGLYACPGGLVERLRGSLADVTSLCVSCSDGGAVQALLGWDYFWGEKT